jgi:hypothetical protein
MLFLLQLGTGLGSMWVPGHELRSLCAAAREANTFCDSLTQRISSTPISLQQLMRTN